MTDYPLYLIYVYRKDSSQIFGSPVVNPAPSWVWIECAYVPPFPPCSLDGYWHAAGGHIYPSDVIGYITGITVSPDGGDMQWCSVGRETT